jgi:hypothetical protein
MWFYIVESEDQDDLTELPITTERSLGDAVQALCCRMRNLSHPALRVAFCPDECIELYANCLDLRYKMRGSTPSA